MVKMEKYFKVTFWFLILLTPIVGIVTASDAPRRLRQKTSTTPESVIYVTPSGLQDDKKQEKAKTKMSRSETTETRRVMSTVATRRSDNPPTRFTFPTDREDQLRLQSVYNHRRPAKAEQRAPEPILSSSRDITLTQPEHDSSPTQPATYETIVYNPANKDASSAFSRSDFWETPELAVRDTNQRHEGKNTLVTTSSHIEYTPNQRSIQTPLNKIQYRGHSQPMRESPTRTQPYRRPTPATTPQVFENVSEEEEDEEESQNQEVEDDNEELNEAEEDDEEEERRPTYPVNLENHQSFNPFENVQEPHDIYSDVLTNIGSVFNDDHSSLPQKSPLRETNQNHRNSNGAKSLLPQFEQYSYENLQQQERASDDVREHDGDYEEDNEELAEYEDDDEGGETQVQQKNAKETPKESPSPLNSVQHFNHRQKEPAPQNNGQTLHQSPFPNVKIIKQNEPQPQKAQGAASFSPWLPTQPPSRAPIHRPWPHTSQRPYQQSWQQSAPQTQQQKPRPYQWEQHSKIKKEAQLKPSKATHTSPQSDKQPYNDSYKTSYNKSWSSSSPKKNEKSAYNKSWKDSKHEKPKHKSYKKEQNYAETKREETSQKPEQRLKKLSKTPKKSSSSNKEIIRRSDSLPEESTTLKQVSHIFVTPLPFEDDVTSSSNSKSAKATASVEDSAVDAIDELYRQQHFQV